MATRIFGHSQLLQKTDIGPHTQGHKEGRPQELW